MRLILHAVLVLFLTQGTLIAQWQSINSPPGGYIRDMIQVGTTIYAASGGGVLYSQDQGSSWSWVNTGLSSHDTKCLVEIQDTVYVGTDYGLFRWSPTEETWQSAGSELLGKYVKDVLLLNNVMIVGTYGEGIYRSTDFGATWSLSINGFTGNNVYFFETDGSRIYAGTYKSGLFASDDLGLNWVPINNGLPELDIMAVHSFQNKIFVATLNSGVFVSVDQGNQWVPLEINLPSIKFFDHRGSRLYAVGLSGVHVSDDQGVTWSVFNQGLSENSLWSCLSGADYFYVGGKSGRIYRRNYDADPWEASSTLSFNPPIGTIGFSGDQMLVGSRGSGFFATSSGGNQWSRISSIWTVENRSMLTWDNKVLVGTDLLGAFKSVDNGLTFNAANSGLEAIWVECFALNQSILLAGTRDAGIFRSDNQASSWSTQTTGLSDSSVIDLDSYLNDYIALFSQGIYRSSDTGFSWEPLSNEMPVADPVGVEVLDDRLWLAGRQSGVQTWDLISQTWADQSQGLPAQTHVRVLKVHLGVLWLGTNSGRLYWWNETIGGWSAAINLNLNSPIIAIESNQDRLYLGTSSGEIWVNDLAQILAAPSLTGRSDKLFIWPNPVKDSFEIFGLNRTEILKVVLYNRSGQLIHANKDVLGRYLMSGLPVGLYIAEVQTRYGKHRLKILKSNE